VQAISDDWLLTYNDYRPHEALGDVPPTRFLPRPTLPDSSCCGRARIDPIPPVDRSEAVGHLGIPSR
jgi:hypothetical protein